MASSTPSCQPRASAAGNTFPPIGRIVRNISAGLALSLPLAVCVAQPAQAALIFNFYESGSDLVIEGTGSLNLPLSSRGPDSCPASGVLGFLGTVSTICTGPSVGGFSFLDLTEYAITGSPTLGAGIITSNAAAYSSSNSGIGLSIAFSPSGYYSFSIDSTYVSGASIFSSSTFTGITLASLGMPNSGTLGTWTLSDPSDPSYVGDTISVQVNPGGSLAQVNAGGSLASVPGPLPILGVAAAFGFSRKLRKRIKLHKDTSAVSTPPGS
jgi:hypothetical protein